MLDPPHELDSDFKAMPMNPITRSHLFSLHYLVPFLLMAWVHQVLGFSNAFMKGDRPSAAYNLVMIYAMFFGAFAFMLHPFSRVPPSGRCLIAKFCILFLPAAVFAYVLGP